MQIEILKRDKLNYVFRSLSFISIAPVLLLEPLKNWAVSNFSFVKNWYYGKSGMIVQILILIITFVSYILVRKLKDNGSVNMDTKNTENPWQAKVYKNKNVKLVIGGDGSQKEWLKGIAKETGVEPQVLFTGALSREEVASWMNKCHIFVLPSRYETFGVVYIEALASGKPVIATFNGGAEDIINEEVGVLVEIDNVNKLAQAMEKVRENYNKYNPESLRNYCTEKFSANVIIKKIINVYKKVIR